MSLKGSKTESNLKDAFAGESQANRRYLYFAQRADVEGYNDVSTVFRSTAEGETGHAHGHLQYLEEVGDPATGEPIWAGPWRDFVSPAGASIQADAATGFRFQIVFDRFSASNILIDEVTIEFEI